MSHILQKFIKKKGIIGDILAILALSWLGFLLIGYYAWFQYIETGYPDWMFHAYRIKNLLANGLISWSPNFSNGVNFWRSYQYVSHYAVIALLKIFTSLSITQAMMVLTIIVVILTRVILYCLLRWGLKISTWVSFFSTLVTYTLMQQWIALQDFSIFIVAPLVPIYAFLWLKCFANPKLLYLLSIFTGFMFSMHPLLGIIASGLWVAYILFSNQKILSYKNFIASLLLGICALAFVVQLLFYGYSFSNPAMSSVEFFKLILHGEYLGMGLTYVILLVLSWLIVLLKTLAMPRWSKILLLCSTIFLALVGLGLNGYLPSFLLKLQISRGIFFLTFLLPFVFATVLEIIHKNWKSRFLSGIYAALIAILITESITVANRFLGSPLNKLNNPLLNFPDNQPYGSIYVAHDDIATASYFAPNSNFRFTNSYIEHLEANPLSQNFKKFMKNDLSYTSLSSTQLRNIDNYSRILGVEYYLLPMYSQLTKLLPVYQRNGQNVYQKVELDNPGSVLIRQIRPINYAYLIDKNIFNQQVSLVDFPQPNLHNLSLTLWNDEVAKMNDLIDYGQLRPVSLVFDGSERLKIDLSGQDLTNKILIVTQNHSPFWSVSGHPELEIKATSLRFIYLELNKNVGKQLILEHQWPKYHFFIQFLPYFLLGIIVNYLVFSKLIKSLEKDKNKIKK